MLQNIKKEVQVGIEELFAVAATNEAANDSDAYADNLRTIGEICRMLGLKTKYSVAIIELMENDEEDEGK